MSDYYGWASVACFVAAGFVRVVSLIMERWSPSAFFERKTLILSLAIFASGLAMVAVALYDSR